jgi:hypothetical protein
LAPPGAKDVVEMVEWMEGKLCENHSVINGTKKNNPPTAHAGALRPEKAIPPHPNPSPLRRGESAAGRDVPR